MLMYLDCAECTGEIQAMHRVAATSPWTTHCVVPTTVCVVKILGGDAFASQTRVFALN